MHERILTLWNKHSKCTRCDISKNCCWSISVLLTVLREGTVSPADANGGDVTWSSAALIVWMRNLINMRQRRWREEVSDGYTGNSGWEHLSKTMDMFTDRTRGIFLKNWIKNYTKLINEWWWLSAEFRPLPECGCFGLVQMFLGGEWVSFLQPMIARRWGWEWIKHSRWAPFRPEKMADDYVVLKKRKISSSEVKHQADKTRSRTRVNLSLTFSRFRALKERLRMKSEAELTCCLLDR